MAVIFDVFAIALSQGYWSEIARWMMVSGVVMGLIAAPLGLIDWLAIPRGTRAKRIGALHGLGNVVVLLMFTASAWLRWSAAQTPAGPAIGLSAVGCALALVTGWLGGELVERLGVGIDDNAHVDAPSSLGRRDAA